MTQITIPNEPIEVTYSVIVASTGPFTVPFTFFTEEDVQAQVTNALGLVTDLVVNSNFVFTTKDIPVGQEGNGFTGGTITLNSSIGADGDSVIRIFRETVVDRTANYPTTGPFSMPLLNDEQNKQIIILQEFKKRLKDKDTNSLALDGSTVMTGAIDAGGQDVQNAADVFVDTLTIGGILVSVTAFAGNNIIKTYLTVAAMKAAVDLVVGDTATTQGYTTAGDGGQAAYRIVAAATGTDDGGSYHDLTGISGQAELLCEDVTRVKVFGAIGDGIVDDNLSISAAITYAGVGGTVLFKSGDIYPVNQITALTGQTWIGFGATIKRIPLIVTTLISPVSIGPPATIDVASTAGFYLGMEVTLKSHTIAEDVAGSAGEIRTWPISDIGVGTITLSGGTTTKAYVAGNYLLSSGNMIEGDGEKVSYLGFTLDGNQANNALWQRWEMCSNIRFAIDKALVQDCDFKNCVADALLISGTGCRVINNNFQDVNGNGIHLSAAFDTKIEGNVLDNTNAAGANIGHTEGAIIASNFVNRTFILNNIITNCNGYTAIGSFQDEDNSEVTIIGNYIKDTIIAGTVSRPGIEVFAANDFTVHNIISGNTIINAGEISIANSNNNMALPVGDPVDGLFSTLISGNVFEKTGIEIGGWGVSLTGNTFFRVPDIDSFISPTIGLGATVHIQSLSQHCLVNNNTFLDTDSSAVPCIFLEGVTDNITISDNTIYGYGYAIRMNNAGIRHPNRIRISGNRFEEQAIQVITVGNISIGDTGALGHIIEGNYFKGSNTSVSSGQVNSETPFGVVYRNNTFDYVFDSSNSCIRTNDLGAGSLIYGNVFILVKELTASVYAVLSYNDNDYTEYNYATDNAPTGGVFRDLSPSSPTGATFTNNRSLSP